MGLFDSFHWLETSPHLLVSNWLSGQGLCPSQEAGSGKATTRRRVETLRPERGKSVSDWASALLWGRDESELVTELQSGSEAAFDWLVTHHHAAVFNLILGMLSDAFDAADCTQEVFLKAFKGIRQFRQGSSLRLGFIASPFAKP